MDEADIASAWEEKFREISLLKRKPVPEHDGFCLNCGKESDGVYCDADCRDDAERFDRARIRNGEG